MKIFCMNRIKTNIRNRLLFETLRELMMIDLNGDEPGKWSLESIPEWFKYWEKNFNPRSSK